MYFVANGIHVVSDITGGSLAIELRGEHITLFPKKYLGKVSHFGQLWEEFIHFDQNI